MISILRAMTLSAFGFFALACGPSYPNCNTDEQCHEHEYCVNSRCQACRDDSNCPAGQQCASGACEAIQNYCTTSATCGVGRECVANRCVQASVVNTSSNNTTTPGTCELQAVYFGYDDSNLDSAARDVLEANARCIRDRSMSTVIITGMTDPRGTEEYNLALGDRRARSVSEHLQRLGGTASAQVRSMGEEAATGEDESGWTRDRRADLHQP